MRLDRLRALQECRSLLAPMDRQGLLSGKEIVSAASSETIDDDELLAELEGARLFSTFKKRVREGAYPNREKAREKLSGFLFDVQHAATYVPYCDAFFTDRFMADLLNDKHVDAEQTFGCKVFSISRTTEFFGWLEDQRI